MVQPATENGYGDPLRVKVIPDFSFRFVDSAFAAENATITTIQADLVAYFGGRDTELSRKGRAALASSFAAIYYVPYQAGISLHFRFRFGWHACA
jgi:hypothetical protein